MFAGCFDRPAPPQMAVASHRRAVYQSALRARRIALWCRTCQVCPAVNQYLLVSFATDTLQVKGTRDEAFFLAVVTTNLWQINSANALRQEESEI